MFDRDELAEVLALHQKSYELLKWVGRNLDSGVLDFNIMHESASSFDAAREWIVRHWANLPEAIRPAKHQLDVFARLFSSYLTTSFKLVENPRRQSRSYCGCWCSYCTYLGQADRLQVKTPSKGAKRSAEELKRVYLNLLAAEQGQSLALGDIDAMLSDSDLQEVLAMATYCHELIRRTKFASQGEGVLALWRQFAWSEHGGPRAKFNLDQVAVCDAERRVLDRLIA